MGMKKISIVDEKRIVRILRNWAMGTRLTWDALRNRLVQDKDGEAEQTWSRQSLSANNEISTAFSLAKKRLARKEAMPHLFTDADYQQKIADLEGELADVQAKYDRLILHHAKLAYNASLLEGGSKLLDDPLPDNTKSQRG